MDWHMIVVGVVSFFAGMATAVMLGAMVAAGRDDQRMGQHSTRSTRSTQHTQNTHTDTHST